MLFLTKQQNKETLPSSAFCMATFRPLHLLCPTVGCSCVEGLRGHVASLCSILLRDITLATMSAPDGAQKQH